MSGLPPVYLNRMGMVSPLGSDPQAVLSHLLGPDRSGLSEESGWAEEGSRFVGRIRQPLASIPDSLAHWDSRVNRCLLSALQPIEASVQDAIERFGRGRVGIVLGSSTSGILDVEAAMLEWSAQDAASKRIPDGYNYTLQELGSPSRFLADYLNIKGPAYTLSTACTSSAKALVSAWRLLHSGACDAVIAGGADTLCQMTLRGFASLEALSAGFCNPFARERDGINIGEAAALFLMTREPGPVALAGAGETSDAYHVSAPDPSGKGAIRAMSDALHSAGIDAREVDYINLHGTATRQNDAMESRAVNEVLGDTVAASSSKSLTGHTLGAAGALEAAFCWLLLGEDNVDSRVPRHLMDGVPDPDLANINLSLSGGQFQRRHSNWMMSNSFAFGGSNVSLLLKSRLGI